VVAITNRQSRPRTTAQPTKATNDRIVGKLKFLKLFSGPEFVDADLWKWGSGWKGTGRKPFPFCIVSKSTAAAIPSLPFRISDLIRNKKGE
jgi:hypothetical protein